MSVLVVTSGVDIGSPIAAGLAQRGAPAAWLTDSTGPAAAPLPPGFPRIQASFGSRADLEAAFARAASELGAIDQVVHCAMPMAALESRDFATLPEDIWRAACAAAMKATLYCLQAAHTHMHARGGSIVVVGPTLALAGAARLVALSTALEGQRGLAKSAARQWGALGLTVNWIAAAPAALSPLFASASLPSKPDPVPVAFGRAPDVQSEIVPVIQFLAGREGRVMTGATLVLDGGEWMVP